MHGVAERVQYPVMATASGSLSAYIANSCDQVIYDDIFVAQEYKPAIDRVRKNPSNRPVCILDLGMNMGYFALYCANRLDDYRVVGIEAVPEIARECERRLSLQPIRVHSRIATYMGVVGKRTGSVGVEISLSHPCNRIVNGARPMAPDTTQVRLLKYIDVLSLDLPEHIDLLKCDIEGAEEQFCESYPELLKRCDAVVIEMHPKLCDKGVCQLRLIQAGLTEMKVLNVKPKTTLQLFTRPT